MLNDFTLDNIVSSDIEGINKFIKQSPSMAFLDIMQGEDPTNNSQTTIADVVDKLDGAVKESKMKSIDSMLDYNYQFSLLRDAKSRYACRNAIMTIANDRKLYYDQVLLIVNKAYKTDKG